MVYHQDTGIREKEEIAEKRETERERQRGDLMLDSEAKHCIETRGFT